MASLVEIIIKTIDESTNANGDIIGSFTELNSVIGIGKEAIDMMRQAYDMTVGSTLEYADTIRTVSAQTGLTTEATSHLVDLFDKFDVSTSALTMAQKTLAKEGLSLNIDTLKKMADQYNALGTQAEKTAFLMQNFGRSGLDLAAMFDQGSAAMQKYYDSTNASMVMTKMNMEQLQQLKINQKDAADAWQGLANTMTLTFLPALTRATSMTADFINATDEEVHSTDHLATVQGVLMGWLEKRVKAGNEAAAAEKELAAATDQSTKAAEKGALSGAALTAAVQAQATANADLYGIVNQMQAQSDSYYQKQSDLTAQIDEQRAALQKAKSQWGDNSQAVQDIKNKIGDLTGAMQDNAEENEKATRKVVLNMIEQRMAAQGMTDDQMNGLLALGEKWGIYSKGVVEQAKSAESEIATYTTKLQSIPTSITTQMQAMYKEPPNVSSLANSGVAPVGYGNNTQGQLSTGAGTGGAPSIANATFSGSAQVSAPQSIFAATPAVQAPQATFTAPSQPNVANANFANASSFVVQSAVFNGAVTVQGDGSATSGYDSGSAP